MSDRLFVSTRKGLFEFRRAADGWALAGQSFLGSPVTIGLHDGRDGALYAALNLGHFGHKLHRSDDGGGQWTEIAAPAFAPSEEKDAPAVGLIWALAADPRMAGGLWAGTIPAALFHSADGGQSWTLNQPLWDLPDRADWFGGGYDDPGLHSIVVDPRDPRRLAVGLSCGGVWLSEDGGDSWNLRTKGMNAAYMPPELADKGSVQDPHRLVQCAGAPQVWWVQHHNGIYRSDDDLASWQELRPANCSGFGFAVAAHPADGGTAWFVPARKDEFRYPEDGKFIASRTRDGGRSFERLEDGLPQIPSYDLVYRHALAVDDSGARLAMGSTSGGAWISEDGGDHWRELPVRLPPVHAVMFA